MNWRGRTLETLASFLEERTPGCEARVIRSETDYGILASIYIDDKRIHADYGEALRALPHVDWKAFAQRRPKSVGPYASRVLMRKSAGL